MAGEQLRVTEGSLRGKRLSVDAELLIGRAAPKDEGRLGDDPEISRRHARVSRGDDGRLTIEDLGSANGTFVNGEPIDAPRTLGQGDVVRMGQTVLQVTDSAGEVPGPTRISTGGPVEELTDVAAAAGEELLVTDGTAKGRRLVLTDEFLIGRAVSGDGRLGDDPELSRRHARVSRGADGRLTVEDLGSANGTFVNGERIRGPRALELGDAVQVGRTTLQLTEAGRGSAVASQAAPPVREAPPPAPSPVPEARPATPPPPPPRRAPAPPPPAREPTPVTEQIAAELPLGTVFAGCRVEELIGRGDMGVVYRAEELALQRPVALKLILSEYSHEERFRERFRRESRVAAAIDHPNVIPVFEAGDESGVLFITMRLVEGTDLRALIAQEGGLEPLRTARIVGQVGAALDAAHSRGLVHRDVKPANVLLARGEHVYLSDFGLAKRSTEQGGLTRQGSILARAEYVAPEQITSDRADALTDVYALGCLLFEALTGEAPFAESKGGAAMLAHVDAPPPSPREHRPDLPVQFDEIVRRAMAKDPRDRYPSAGDLGQAALVAAGGLRRARAESVVATGDAAPFGPGAPGLGRPARAAAAARAAEGPPSSTPSAAQAAPRRDRGDAIRWGIALATLVILAVCMVAALGAISKL